MDPKISGSCGEVDVKGEGIGRSGHDGEKEDY